MIEGAGLAGQRAIDDHAELNRIIEKPRYDQADLRQLLKLEKRYRFAALDPPDAALVQLHTVRKNLYSRSRDGTVSVKAAGRADWVGWFELHREDVRWKAIYNTGRVVAEVDADIVVTIEVENRPSLIRFNEQVLGPHFGKAYPHVMVIDGNDVRGIDVGIMSRHPINAVRSHVDDRNPDGERTFSRDCPEYVIELGSGKRLVVLPNYF